MTTVFTEKKPGTGKDALPGEKKDPEPDEKDEQQPRPKRQYLQGFFVVCDAVEANLAHIMDPLQRGNEDSESVNTILRGQIAEE